MNRTRITWLCVVLALLLGTGVAFAQAGVTGNISGRITNEGQGLPGVSVTAKSPNLQGVRTTVTSVNGDYYFANLPAGQYIVRMELSGFAAHEEKVQVGAAQSVTVNAAMSLKSVEASAVVVARSEQVSTGSADSSTYTSDLMNKLPVARTLVNAVSLAPGVNQNGPSAAIMISGAMSFENNMMIDGANIQDNIRGTPSANLYIEDAVQETTTTSSSVSAEYGRFTGGVVNTITKSGGNTFSGSFRATLNNDTWRELTPYSGDIYSHGTVPTYEATLGGPFWKDHVWFFGAFRSASTSFTGTTSPPTEIGFPRGSTETRWEGKLTITPVQNQTLTGIYVPVSHTDTGYYFTPLPILDLASVYDRELPTNYWAANYNGVLSESLFLEGQYSQKHFTFVNSGGTDQTLLGGTVFQSLDPFGYYHAPIFCANCPGAEEKRDNTNYFGKLNWFVSTKGLGSHNMVIGYESFAGSRTSNNWQSGSSYFMNATSVVNQGGNLFPVVSDGSYLGYYPIFNVAQPSNVKTQSGFFNDSWKLNENFSFNLGVRYDKNNAQDSRGVTTNDDSKFSPRLAAIWDPTGKGTFRVNVGYAVYTAAPQETQVGAGSSFGAPAYFGYYYNGPGINTGAGPYLTQNQVLQQFFNYYGITGVNQFPTQGNTVPDKFVGVPGVNVQIIPGGLISPNTEEWSVGAGGSVGRRFTYRVEGVYRNYRDFYTQYTDMSTGQVSETQFTGGQTFDLTYVGNTSTGLSRKYYGLHTNFQWRPFDSLNVGGSWTWSHLYGNFIGEAGGGGSTTAAIYNYPEYHDNAWFAQSGNLQADMRHRVRLFGSWDIPFPKAFGHFSLGFLESFQTGLPLYAQGTAAAVRTQRYVPNPGYAIPPSSVTYFYTGREYTRTASVNSLDLSLNYGINIGPVELFVSPQVINVFNSAAINTNNATGVSQTVETATSRSANYATFNPFTTVPVQGPRSAGCNVASPPASCANWNFSNNFGSALAAASYQTPFTFRISMGVRF